MRSSSSDTWSDRTPETCRAPETRGTWVRLTVLVLLVVLLLASSAVELTSALLTDTTQVSSVVSTSPGFPAPAPTPPAG